MWGGPACPRSDEGSEGCRGPGFRGEEKQRSPLLPHPQAAQQPARRVKQLQFTTWPDHGVPETPSSLLAFVDLVQEQARAAQGTGPLLVHCR